MSKFSAFGFIDYQSADSAKGYFGMRNANSTFSDYIQTNSGSGYKIAHSNTSYSGSIVTNANLLGVVSAGFV